MGSGNWASRSGQGKCRSDGLRAPAAHGSFGRWPRLRASRSGRSRVLAVLTPVRTPDSQQQGGMEALRAARMITAIKTPYLDCGKMDLRSYDRIVEHQIAAGVDGLIIGGTTGEGQLMSWDEHIMLIAHTVNQFGRDLLVIGNTGSNATREAVHATEQGFAVGMHAALQINPYYGRTSRSGLLNHFRAVLNEGPGILYNVPGRTGQDIPNEIVHELSSHANFLGIKECTGNQRIKAYAERGILCWTGNDDEAHAARHAYGAQGVISVTSNVIPSLYVRLMRQQNDALADSLRKLVAWLFCEPNPIPINTALAMCGLIRPVFRLPYVPLSLEQRELGAQLLQAVAADLPGVSEVKVMEDSDFKLVSRY